MKIKQKLLVLCILSCQFYLSSATNSLFSQISYAQDADCQTAIANSVKRIENAKATVVKFDKYDQTSRGYKDYPENRPSGYLFILARAGIRDVFASPVFLKDISRQIISSCQSISSVDFAQQQTDGGLTYGLMKNGKVELFECVAPDRSKPYRELPWGKNRCL